VGKGVDRGDQRRTRAWHEPPTPAVQAPPACCSSSARESAGTANSITSASLEQAAKEHGFRAHGTIAVAIAARRIAHARPQRGVAGGVTSIRVDGLQRTWTGAPASAACASRSPLTSPASITTATPSDRRSTTSARRVLEVSVRLRAAPVGGRGCDHDVHRCARDDPPSWCIRKQRSRPRRWAIRELRRAPRGCSWARCREARSAYASEGYCEGALTSCAHRRWTVRRP
jgi:hypothetical protein